MAERCRRRDRAVEIITERVPGSRKGFRPFARTPFAWSWREHMARRADATRSLKKGQQWFTTRRTSHRRHPCPGAVQGSRQYPYGFASRADRHVRISGAFCYARGYPTIFDAWCRYDTGPKRKAASVLLKRGCDWRGCSMRQSRRGQHWKLPGPIGSESDRPGWRSSKNDDRQGLTRPRRLNRSSTLQSAWRP
jgi:hypothetical protein